jgi:hypothetical protein
MPGPTASSSHSGRPTGTESPAAGLAPRAELSFANVGKEIFVQQLERLLPEFKGAIEFVDLLYELQQRAERY